MPSRRTPPRLPRCALPSPGATQPPRPDTPRPAPPRPAPPRPAAPAWGPAGGPRRGRSSARRRWGRCSPAAGWRPPPGTGGEGRRGRGLGGGFWQKLLGGGFTPRLSQLAGCSSPQICAAQCTGKAARRVLLLLLPLLLVASLPVHCLERSSRLPTSQCPPLRSPQPALPKACPHFPPCPWTPSSLLSRPYE